MPATIKFRDFSFDQSGIPRYGWQTTYETAGDGQARVAVTSYTIKQSFTENSFADNEARIAVLKSALDQGEGVLGIKDENGTPLVNDVVKVKSHDVPEEWRQNLAEVTVVLEGRKLLSTNTIGASITPTGGISIALPNITSWKESIRTERYSTERANRRETTITISGGGKILADKTIAKPQRIAALQATMAAMRLAHSKDGTLVYGNETRLVQVQSLDVDPGDGSEELNWSFEAFYKSFPNGEYAETEYELSTKDDRLSGERTLSLRGEVRSDNRARAVAKVSEIKALYAAEGRSLTQNQVDDKYADGLDNLVWIGLSFSFEFRETIPDIRSWDLKISTKDDPKSSDVTISYDGRVVGKTAGDALSMARSLGLNKYPFAIGSNETVSTRQIEGEAEQFIEVEFSYEYLTKSTWISAEITRELAKETFGEQREIISGYTSAATLTDAQALAESFKIPGRLLRDSRESHGERTVKRASPAATTTQIARLDFSYSYYLTPASASISYSREESVDYTAIEQSVTFNGVAYGPSVAACNSLIDATIASAGVIGVKVSRVRTPGYEKQGSISTAGNAGAGQQMISVSFSERYTGSIAGSGISIIQAEWSMNTLYSINKSVMTTLPFSQAHIQRNCGVTIGVKTASGSVTALSPGAAENWGRAKKGLAWNGGEEDAPEERMTEVFPPLEGNSPKAYRFEFTYSARFANLYLN